MLTIFMKPRFWALFNVHFLEKKFCKFWSFFRPYFLPKPLVEATAGLHMDHMGALKDFGKKYGRKNDQNLPIFFFQKIDI